MAVLIGDTKTDYLTGTNAGVDVCTVTYGYGTPSEVLALGARYSVASMQELLMLLQ